MNDDIGRRAAITYGFLSFAFMFAEWNMRYMGAASPRNPAWLLISAIYTLLKWTWWIGAIGAAIFFAFRLIEPYYARRKELNLEVEWQKQLNADRLKRIESQKIELRKAAERGRLERVKKKIEIQTIHRLAKQLREARRRRSPTAAVETAFKEFCKGGL